MLKFLGENRIRVCLAVAAIAIASSLTNPAHGQGVNENIPDKLRHAYDKAFETMFMDPGNLKKTFAFAGLAIKAGDFEGAISSLERMLIMEPDLPRVRFELGMLYFKLGSYDVAANYFEELLEDEKTPKAILEKVKPFIEEIENRVTNHVFGGNLFSGVRYQTNASSGPRSTKVVLLGFPTFLPQELSNQGDVDGFISGGLNYTYDFQSEPRKVLEAGINFYANEQADQTFVNARLIDIHIGPRFILPVEMLNNPVVRPFLAYDYLIVSEDESYYSHGAGINASARVSEKLNLTFDAKVMARENEDAVVLDGYRNNMSISASYIFSKSVQLQFSSTLATEETKTKLQNNRDYGLNGTVSKIFTDPFGFLKDPLTASVSLGGSFREYGDANPAIDPRTTRNDYTIRISPSLTIPAGQAMAFMLSGGYTKVDSNIPNSEYDNLSLTLGISRQF